MSYVSGTCRTEGQTKIYTIVWTVTNFTDILGNKNIKEIRADKLKDLVDLKFQLKMLFLGHNKDIIEIYYLLPNPVTLKSSTNLSLIIKEFHPIQANKWQYLITFFKDRISYPVICDGNLHLEFQFTVYNDNRVERSHVPETELSKYFQDLLRSGLFSDVTLKSSEGVKFKVHKGILAIRSAVLKAHFEHNTTECITNVIESPFDSEVLKEVLTFFYSDKTPRVDEMPEKLFVAADYYQLSRLKNLCEEALHKKLTVDNAMEILQLADLHSANTLKQLTLEFIKDGQAKLIIKTEGWAKIKFKELIKQIFEYITGDEVEDIN